ncbi:MAG: porin, partial [Verrucomicrobiales bacterium]|nr:porin [Verrucomicrobiales bacterium]
ASYTGPNSLVRDEPVRTTYTGTLFLGAKLWEGAEVYVNPEVSGGKGLSGTVGVAGFPNGEATRVGDPTPTPYFARYFFRQRFDLGGETESVVADQNQLAGNRDQSSFSITLGKMAAGDVFDDNSYSHDPRTQFMDWALMANGAWDYPADTRGYTYGLTLELRAPLWSMRAGTFMVPTDANGGTFDKNFGRASGNALELEQDYQLFEQPGKLRLLGFVNFANMGNYADAINQSPSAPDVTATRAYRTKYGFGLNWEQQITTNIGGFGRLGWNDGQSETWMFTEIDQSASLGLSIKGTRWGRKNDTFGMAGVVNGISEDHRRYLGVGGLGFIIGEGQLNYSPEGIFETFYSFGTFRYFFITVAFQHIENPAYNRDRGPANIGTLRLHCEF